MSVYQPAYDDLRRRFAAHDPRQVAALSGARLLESDRIVLRCVGQDYTIGVPDGLVRQADGADAKVSTAILLLLYLIESTGRAAEDRWIAFEQLPGGPGYSASFRGRVVAPVLQAFGQRPDALTAAAATLDGEPLAMGDVAVRLPALPRVPLAYVMWRGDDEFGPSVTVVFDASVEGYLDAEALTALAELATHRLVDAGSSVTKE